MTECGDEVVFSRKRVSGNLTIDRTRRLAIRPRGMTDWKKQACGKPVKIAGAKKNLLFKGEQDSCRDET